MAVELSDEELARRLGEPLERVREWLSLGLLGQEEPRSALALARGRLVQYLRRHGVSLAQIAEAFAGELATMVARYLEARYAPEDPPAFDLPEAAARAGITVATARKLLDAIGLPDGSDFLNLEDVEFLGGWSRVVDAGMGEDAILQLLRVYRDALARVGEAEIRLFHFYVHERLRAAGLTGEALAAESRARAQRLLPLIEPSLRYFHRVAFAAANREDMLLHIGAGAETSLDTPAQLAVGIVFADLSSFTPLTEAMGDEAASRVVQRFAALVYEAAARWSGRVVKQIGDAAMLVFFDPQAAVSFALDVVEAARREASFPAARCGVHWGPALYREGDYFGAAVNFAARLVAVAERHQVLVSSAVRNGASDLGDVEFRPRGVTALKGVLEAPELFEVVRAEHEPPPRLRDLVCGMELAPSEVAARLALGGEERAFCSETCLRRFVANPSQYLGP